MFLRTMIVALSALASTAQAGSSFAANPAQVRGHVLVVVSAASSVPLIEGGVHPTGTFLGELTEPAQAMIDAGYELTFVTPGGRAPTLDEDSLRPLYFGLSKSRRDTVLANYNQLLAHGLSTPLKLEEITDEQLTKFDALFVPGGHGPLVDLLFRDIVTNRVLNTDMGRILAYFHNANKPMGLICHAPVVLLTAPDVNGEWMFKGYKMTAVSRELEWYNENVPGLRVVKGHVGYYPATMLAKAGARFVHDLIPTQAYVTEDRELMTGQDPFAAALMGKRFVKKLNREVP